jgi:predicted enzyme related to lactoylglutathione lyase
MSGKLVHFELPSEDTARAREFWSGVFDWTFRDPGMPGFEYWMTQNAPDQGGAVMRSEGDARGLIVYFDTDDIEESIGRVRALGGEADDKSPIPHIGWFARCKDTEGNEFSLFQSDESVSG